MPLEPLQSQLAALEAELHHPGVRCSRSRLEQLLHPAFHEVGRSGTQYTREAVLEFLLAQAQHPTVVATDYAIQQLAEGCALLTYRSAHATPDGTHTMHALRSSIWFRTVAGWQLIYHQGTPAPSPA